MDADFEWNVWADQTSRIPQVHIGDALRAVVDRKKTIDQEPVIRQQEIEVARIFHDQAEHPSVDGIPVWVAPPARFAAYPPGCVVYHADGVWEQMTGEISMEEPGTGTHWHPVHDSIEDMTDGGVTLMAEGGDHQ